MINEYGTFGGMISGRGNRSTRRNKLTARLSLEGASKSIVRPLLTISLRGAAESVIKQLLVQITVAFPNYCNTAKYIVVTVFAAVPTGTWD
jgi:hypothetical protein